MKRTTKRRNKKDTKGDPLFHLFVFSLFRDKYFSLQVSREITARS